MTLHDSLAALVRWAMRDVTYHRLYPASVQGVNADGTMDVLPDDELVRGAGLSQVPARPGLPGTDVEGALGARCLVGFEAGDPRRPYIAAWSEDALGRIALDRGSRPVARMNEVVEVLLPPVLTVTGVVAGTSSPPNPTPPPDTLDVPLPATPLVGGVAVITAPVVAMIAAGVPKVTS